MLCDSAVNGREHRVDSRQPSQKDNRPRPPIGSADLEKCIDPAMISSPMRNKGHLRIRRRQSKTLLEPVRLKWNYLEATAGEGSAKRLGKAAAARAISIVTDPTHEGLAIFRQE